MPGLKQQGLPVSSLGGRTLTYNCNAYSSLYATIFIVGTLHLTGVFNIADIIDLYGPLLTISSIAGFTLAAVIYVTGEKYRMSGNLVYDYFMGSSLNPRIGSVDIKMWAEIRISWTLLFSFAMGAVAKQYQTYGYVSPNVLLFAYGTGLYLNGCAKVRLLCTPLPPPLRRSDGDFYRASTLFPRLGVRSLSRKTGNLG